MDASAMASINVGNFSNLHRWSCFQAKALARQSLRRQVMLEKETVLGQGLEFEQQLLALVTSMSQMMLKPQKHVGPQHRT